MIKPFKQSMGQNFLSKLLRFKTELSFIYEIIINAYCLIGLMPTTCDLCDDSILNKESECKKEMFIHQNL